MPENTRETASQPVNQEAGPQNEAPTASEAQPHEQPHLGDSLSLEGADSPQAFSLQVLQHNMEVLQKNQIESERLLSLESLENKQVAEMFSEQGEINQLVAETLQEEEQASAFIRRGPV